MKVKRKGEFAAGGPGMPGAMGQKKNPDCEISTEAAVEYLKSGTPIEDTIAACQDIRKFVAVRRVTGGAERDGEYIGKTIRWYYANGIRTGLTYVSNGNSVPMTIGAKPCMELPDTLPDDIDHDHYIREAYAILQDVGITVVDPKLKGRTGRFFGRLPDAKGYHIVQAETGIAICGKTRDSIRDSWVEVQAVPDGARLCGKCKKAELL